MWLSFCLVILWRIIACPFRVDVERTFTVRPQFAMRCRGFALIVVHWKNANFVSHFVKSFSSVCPTVKDVLSKLQLDDFE